MVTILYVGYCMVPHLRSYVGFGVHQIEFATTLSFTHFAHTLASARPTFSHHHIFLEQPDRPALLYTACSLHITSVYQAAPKSLFILLLSLVRSQ